MGLSADGTEHISWSRVSGMCNIYDTWSFWELLPMMHNIIGSTVFLGASVPKYIGVYGFEMCIVCYVVFVIL
jgi:hypothetical protein